MAMHSIRQSMKQFEDSKFAEKEHLEKTHGSQFDLLKNVSKQKSSSRFKESLLAETFERFRTRRMSLRMVEGASYRLKPLSTLHFREDFGGISCLRWSPEGDTLAIGFYSGDLKLCSRFRLAWRPVETVSIIKGWEGNYPISCVKFHPHNPKLIYASSLDGTVSIGQRRPSESGSFNSPNHAITEEGNEINSFDFSSDGATLVTGGKDATIRIYDSKTHKVILMYKSCNWSKKTVSTYMTSTPEESHEKRVFCVKCHPEQPRIFLTGGWDRVVKVWDTRVSETCVRDILGPYIFGECIDINKGTVLTASCVAEGSLDLWDLGSGCLLTKVVPTNKPVYLYGEFPYAAQFHKTGVESGDQLLCGGVGLGGLQVISVDDQKILHLVEDDRPVVAIDSSEMQTAFGGKSNSVSFVSTKGEMFEEKLIQTQDSLSIDYTAFVPEGGHKSNGQSCEENTNET